MSSSKRHPRKAGRSRRRPMPPALARRPKWKQVPIPYVMFIDERGRPDFRVNDEAKRIGTINRRLCALCGQPLPQRRAAFIGGPLCEQNGLFIDGPMHESCARYAFTICPYLAAPNAHHAQTGAVFARHHDQRLSVSSLAGSTRPDRMGLFFASAWRIVRVQGDPQLYFHVGQFEQIEWRP